MIDCIRNSGDLMVKLKFIWILIGVLFVISACAPIDGLDDAAKEAETSAVQEVTTQKPVATTAAVEPETVATPQTMTAKWVKITADALNVRKEGAIDAERLTKIYEKQIYEVLDRNKDSDGLVWFKVEAADGIIGWISSDFCIIADSYDDLVEEE